MPGREVHPPSLAHPRPPAAAIALTAAAAAAAAVLLTIEEAEEAAEEESLADPTHRGAEVASRAAGQVEGAVTRLGLSPPTRRAEAASPPYPAEEASLPFPPFSSRCVRVALVSSTGPPLSFISFPLLLDLAS